MDLEQIVKESKNEQFFDFGNKILYSPVFLVVFTTILLIVGFRYGGFIFQSHDTVSSAIISTFEPDVYNATVIQVGGVGSDIYTNRAYYIGDGSGIHQEGWPIYLNKNTYARVSFNTPFYLMTLSCKDGYNATLLPNETSDLETYSDTDGSFTLRIKDQVKNQLSMQCEKNNSQRINLKKLHDEAYMLMQAKDYSGAIKKAEVAIQLNPSYVDAWVDKGMALYSMGKCTDGAASLYHAVNLDPENEDLGAMLGSMLNKCNTIAEECKRIVDNQLEDSKSKVDNNKTAIEIVKKGCFSVLGSSVVADFDGDGQKEVVMVTGGGGCGSCHAQEIHIIKGDKVIFYKDGSDFTIKLTNNPIGFILEYPEKSLPPSPGDEYVIESYKAIKGESGLESFYSYSKEKKLYIFE